MDLRRFLTAVALPFRSALTSRRGRWWLFGVVTVAGWLALAGWMAWSDDPGDDVALWTMLLICGVVGLGQGLALLPLGTDTRTRKRGKKKEADGTWLLRWWQVLLLAVAHILVVTVLALTLVEPVGYDDIQLGVIFMVLFLGTIGWLLVPLVLFVAIVVVALVVGLIVTGVVRIVVAARSPRSAALSRARGVASGIAMVGGGVAVGALIAAIPFVSSGHGGKGAAVAAAVVLLLQAVGVLPSPDAWWYLLLRLGYLVGILAVVQYLTFRFWGPRIWSDEPVTADSTS
ncbi:hypothetical protein [Leifsonia sp. NPDC077715]|uniref:hypothetical protein n=1 Tax=Leifsonia sp. NPDC077715 TaxID=3155539 RepID=UPI00343D1F1A